MKTFTKSFIPILFLAVVCVTTMAGISLAQQTITWTGAANGNDWETAGNWSSNSVPGASDTVYIPYQVGSSIVNTVNVSSNVTVAKLDVEATGLYINSGSLTATTSSTFGASTYLHIGTTTTTASMTIPQGGICTYNGNTITINGASKLINNGMLQIESDFTTTLTLTNGTGLLINNGQLWRGAPGKTPDVQITNDSLANNGLIQNAYGTLTIKSNTYFKGGSLIANDSTSISLAYGRFHVKDTLRLGEAKTGKIILYSGTLSTDSINVLAPNVWTYNLGIRHSLTMDNGKLTGSGKWISYVNLISGGSSYNTIGNLVNQDTITQTTGLGLYLTGGDTLWNKGVVDLQSNGSISYTNGPKRGVIVNDSLIQKSAGTNASSISPMLINNGTLWAKSGELATTDTLYQHNGRWMSDAGATLDIRGTQLYANLAGKITGQSNGTIYLEGDIKIDTLSTTTLDVGGNGVICDYGSVAGPGHLTNTGTFDIRAGLSIGIETLFTNAGDMTIANTGQSMAVDQYNGGYIYNTGALHLNQGADVRGNTILKNTPMILNTGTIFKDGDSGTATIGGLLDNRGTIEVNRGKLNLNNNWQRNATITVADTASLSLSDTMRVQGSVGGQILGTLQAGNIFSADTMQTSTLNFTGNGTSDYYSATFVGPGRWINTGIIHGSTGYLKFNQILTNKGTIYFNGTTLIAPGDTLFNDGHIILTMENRGQVNVNGSNNPPPMIVNRGVIQDDGQPGYQYFDVPVINQDTVRVDAGRLILTTSFDNQASGVISGSNGVVDENNNRTYISNEGGIYPYGPYSHFTIQGPLDLSSPTSYIKIDIGGDHLNGNLRVTNTLTGGQGTIHIRATGSYLPQDQSNYDILHAPSGLPSPLPTVVSDINYVHFTETALDTVLQLTALRDLASIGKISRDTVTAGLIAPLTIKGSGFSNQSHFWISEHLPSKPDSVITEDLTTDSLFSDHVNVGIDLREPWWMGRAYIHTQNPGQPADSTSIFIIPVLSVHFKQSVGPHGVGIINGDPYNGRSWTTTRFYAYSSYPVRQFIVGEYIKPRFSFVQSAMSSEYHGGGSKVWDSYTSSDHDHTLLVSSVYPGQFTKLYLSTTISPDHIQFSPPGLTELAQGTAKSMFKSQIDRITGTSQTPVDTSMIPYSAYLAPHYIFWVMPIGQYKMIMQRCVNDTVNTSLSNFLTTLAPTDSLMNASIDQVLSSSLTGRFAQPDEYLKQFLTDLASSLNSTTDVITAYDQSRARFSAMWAYQVSLLIYHSVREHLGADSQPADSSAHQAVNTAAGQLVSDVEHSGNSNITNSLPSNYPDNWFQYPSSPSEPTQPAPPNSPTPNNNPGIQPGGFPPAPGPDICVSGCFPNPAPSPGPGPGPSPGPVPGGGGGYTGTHSGCSPSNTTLSSIIKCVPLVPLVAPFDPNDKVALTSEPAAVDSSNGTVYVRHYYIPVADAQDSLRYSIRFENLPAATGAAHTVTITDTLDSHVDPASFNLMNSSDDSVLSVQRAGRIVTFTFNGIDLPPDTAAPDGEGFVSYAVKPNTGLTSGTMIKNRASIVFDANPPIMTPTVMHVITKTADASLAIQSVSDSLVVEKKDTLSLSVTDYGPDTSDSVHVLMLIPNGITVQSVMGDSSWTQKQDSLTVWMGSVGATKSVTSRLVVVSHITGNTTFAAQVYTSSADANMFNDQALLTEKSVQATPIEATNSNMPTHYSLGQNYPNPFNPTTTIRFALPRAGRVRLDIYNILGQRVATLIDEPMKAGWYNVQWDAHQVASGLYLYRITSGHFVKTKKMLLIK